MRRKGGHPGRLRPNLKPSPKERGLPRLQPDMFQPPPEPSPPPFTAPDVLIRTFSAQTILTAADVVVQHRLAHPDCRCSPEALTALVQTFRDRLQALLESDEPVLPGMADHFWPFDLPSGPRLALPSESPQRCAWQGDSCSEQTWFSYGPIPLCFTHARSTLSQVRLGNG